jgi:peptidylprolyl isomerase
MHVLIILFLFLSCLCLGHEKERLNSDDAAILHVFFQTLFEKEGGGYVLFNQKPVCWSGFSENDNSMPGTLVHRNSVAIKEGMRTWKSLDLKGKNIFLHCCHKENSYGSIDLLLINRSLFLKTIEDNLSLFQYVLGPKVNPSSLLESLLSARDFDSVLKGDRVLIGIILGFGTYNAIVGSRSENIRDSLISSADIPPIESKLTQAPQLTQNEKDFLFFSSSEALSKQSQVYPSFGFSSLEEEFNFLEDRTDLSPPSLRQEPAFIFGYVKDDRQSQVLIQKLEEVQSKVRALMQSPTFLADVLKMMTERAFEVDTSKQFDLRMNSWQIPQLNLIIAKNVWNQIKGNDQEYIKEFLMSFHEPVSQEDIRCGFFPNHYKTYVEQARNNLLESYHLFDRLEKDSEFTSVVTKKLYYKVLKKGSGEPLNESNFVKLTYQIIDPSDTCLVTEFSKILDPSKTIPGFAHGIKGMRIGETREIYMAPSLAYGVHTLLDKGIYLKAKITLLDILPDREAKNYPELTPLDLSFVFDPLFEQRVANENKQVARFEGVRVSKHYAKSKMVNIEEVYFHLINLKNGKNPSSISKSELELINKLHWNIYKNSL